MKCPVDETTLAMSERDGIEIDYCPACRGIWLDRGELDKLIEREERWADDDEPAGERRGAGRGGGARKSGAKKAKASSQPGVAALLKGVVEAVR